MEDQRRGDVMGKTLGDMSPKERAEVVGRAVNTLQAELTANADRIAAVLDAPMPGATEWRVWALFVHDNTWRPVSRTFPTERDAEIWALKLNMEHRTEEEDTD
jgi:hypothetical protein